MTDKVSDYFTEEELIDGIGKMTEEIDKHQRKIEECVFQRNTFKILLRQIKSEEK